MLTPAEYYSSFGDEVAAAYNEFDRDIDYFFKMFSLSHTRKPNVLVIGDLVVDRHEYVKLEPRVERKSNTPIYSKYSQTAALGGAFNYARFFASLGCKTSLVCPTHVCDSRLELAATWLPLLKDADSRYVQDMPDVYFSPGYYNAPHTKTRVLQVINSPELAVSSLPVNATDWLSFLEQGASLRPLHRFDSRPQRTMADCDLSGELLRADAGFNSFAVQSWSQFLSTDSLPDAIVYVMDGSDFCLSAYLTTQNAKNKQTYQQIPTFICYNDSPAAAISLEHWLTLLTTVGTSCNWRGFLSSINCQSPRLLEKVDRALLWQGPTDNFRGSIATDGSRGALLRAVMPNGDSVRTVLPVPMSQQRQLDLAEDRLSASKWSDEHSLQHDFSGSGDTYAAAMIYQFVTTLEWFRDRPGYTKTVEQMHRTSSDIAYNFSERVPGVLRTNFVRYAVTECLDRFSENLMRLGLGGAIYFDAVTLDSVQAFLADGYVRRYGFANGCFDGGHPGHFDFVRKAAADFAKRSYAEMQTLVFALNSDCSIRSLKGESRPLLSERERIFHLSQALTCAEQQVNGSPLLFTPIVMFDEPTTESLLKGFWKNGARCQVIYKGKPVDETAQTALQAELFAASNAVIKHEQPELKVFHNGYFEKLSTTSIYERLE